MDKALLRDVLQWDVGSWKPALYFWEKNVNWKNVNRALELGGREGGLALWLGLKGIDTVCSDLMDVEKTAGGLHEKYGVAMRYEDVNATAIPYENHFDIIVFKSIIGGIGRDGNKQNQDLVFKQVYKALKPGGKLLFAENLAASRLHRFLRSRFVKWGSSWRYVTLGEMQDFLRDFSEFEIKVTGFSAAFGRSETQRNFLSVADKAFFNHIVPASWKYICYGIAEK